MRATGGRLAVASAALAAAACTTPDLDQYWSPEACRDEAVQYVEGIDWARARIVSIRIRQGEYDPLIIRLLQDQPYVFRIINRDDEFRDFRAVEFFEAVAVDNVSISGVDTGESCVTSVTVPPMQTAELRFVAVRDGRYEFEDQPLPLPGIAAWGGSGVISINMKSSVPIARYSDLVPTKPVLGRPPAAPVEPVESEEEGEGAEPPGTKSIFADEDDEEEGEPEPPTTKSIFSDEAEEGEDEEEDEDEPETPTSRSIFDEDEEVEEGEEDEEGEGVPKKAKKTGKKARDLFAEEDEEEDQEARPKRRAKETKTALDSDRDAARPGSLQEILKDEPSPDDETTKSLQEILRETEVTPAPVDPDTEAAPDAETAPDEEAAPGQEAAPEQEAAPDEKAPEKAPPDEVKTVREEGEPATTKELEAGEPTPPAKKPTPGTSLFDTVFGRLIESFGDFVPTPKDDDR